MFFGTPCIRYISAVDYITSSVFIFLFYSLLDDLSPPEKSLRNIHIYEKKNPAPSLGILYDDYKRKEPAASRFGHRGVFVKRHKLKNPFRVEEAEEHEVKLAGRSK